MLINFWFEVIIQCSVQYCVAKADWTVFFLTPKNRFKKLQ